MDHICCSSDCPCPQSLGRRGQRDFYRRRNARLQPAKQTKLTYSLIAFNEGNVIPECCRDPERWRCRKTGCHINKTEQLIFNSKLWIPNHLSLRLPFPQQTLSLICSINGNSVPIKMSYPNEFNLRWNCLWQLVGERSVTMEMNRAVILTLKTVFRNKRNGHCLELLSFTVISWTISL